MANKILTASSIFCFALAQIEFTINRLHKLSILLIKLGQSDCNNHTQKELIMVQPAEFIASTITWTSISNQKKLLQA